MVSPDVGYVGIFILSGPWITNSGDYKCTSLDVINIETDFAKVYSSKGISKADFILDGKDGVLLATLVSVSTGDVLVVPTRYIASVAAESPVKYNRLAITIDLGILPEETDLSVIAGIMTDVANNYTGLNSKAIKHILGETTLKTVAEHDRITAVRAANTAEVVSTYASLELSKQAISDYKQEILRLEQVIGLFYPP